jgi:hypothetical protein
LVVGLSEPVAEALWERLGINSYSPPRVQILS